VFLFMPYRNHVDIMVIVIIKASRETLWYFDSVGAIVEVEEHDKDYYRVIEQNESLTPWQRFLILKKDCRLEIRN